MACQPGSGVDVCTASSGGGADGRSRDGGYLLGSDEGEVRRLLDQAALFQREVRWLLDELPPIGARSAMDLGCGPLGVLPELSHYVGPRGTVVGVDRDPAMLAHAARQCRGRGLANVELCSGDALALDLPAGSFDLAHVRLMLVNVAEPEKLVAQLVRLVRPGGVVAVQEVDWMSWHCEPPLPAWDMLRHLLRQLWASRGFDPCIGRRLPALLKAAGLTGVEAMTHAGVDDGSAVYGRLLVGWAQRFSAQLVALRLVSTWNLDALIQQVSDHLDRSDTIVLRAMTVQAWGRVE